jgi:predicted phage-related endonuclease
MSKKTQVSTATEYIQLKNQIAELETKMEGVKSKLKAELDNAENSEIETEFGRVYYRNVKSAELSSYKVIQELKEDLVALAALCKIRKGDALKIYGQPFIDRTSLDKVTITQQIHIDNK